MNDPTVLIISVCAISAVIAFFMALLLLRVARLSVFGFANLIVRMLVTPKEEPTAAPSAHAANDITLDELKARAHALDFDAAVEQLQRQQENPPEQPSGAAPGV